MADLRKPSQELVKILATNVRTLRKSKGMSQDKLAEYCGLHRTFIGSIERGERNITLSTLEVLSNALEVNVPELLTPSRKD
jgi:transcriptional regulator with XRE-family HTH domain